MAEAVKHSLAWAGYKFASTVLDDIWPQVLFFTGVATMVVTVNEFTTVDISMNSTMLTVLGTIVSLVVSFKTNNSYSRWWEGRNVWTNITTNSRQLAMIIWLQIPNIPKEKDEKKDDKKKGEKGSKEAGKPSEYNLVSAGQSNPVIHPERRWHKKGEKSPAESATEPLIAFHQGDKESEEVSDDSKVEEDETEEEKRSREEKQLLGSLIEKKTYIGLIQAFSVALKHSLRGERGPFYSDLYSLIAFLPKYNPSAFPPITRDHLLVLWQHGMPRQKSHNAADIVPVPLTQPAVFDGYPYPVNTTGKPRSPVVDKEASPGGLTTSSDRFTNQAMYAAGKLINHPGSESNNVSFMMVDPQDDHLKHDSRGAGGNKSEVVITTIELMPARHPPPFKFWDFFPPLRILKVIWDKFKTKQRLEKEQEQEERVKGGKRRRKFGAVKSEIPQEIMMYLSAYVADTAKRGDMGTSFLSPLMTALNELQKAMSDLDKLATTPIPSAYAFHLRLTVWAYLLFLPFQLYQYIRWVTIPATAVASITYLGFLEIGGSIEMPFGYDDSDLDLDKFVLKIGQQLAQVTAFPTSVPTQNIVLSHLNQPFLPSLSLSAPEILGVSESVGNPTTMGFAAAFSEKGESTQEAPKSRPPPKSVRDIEMALNANWREVGEEARKYIGRPRDQLENRTGLDVAVLAL